MRTVAISAFAVIGSLLVLFNIFATSAYTARAPQGADAMGLVVPLGFSIMAALCFIIATIVALSGGRLAWIDARSSIAAVLALLVATGIGASIVSALILWSGSGPFAAPFGIVAAGIAPWMLAAVLMMSRAPDVPNSTASPPMPRALAGLLAPIAMCGIAVGIAQTLGAMRTSAQRNEAGRREAAEFEEKWEKIRNRTPAEAARQDMAEMSPTAPLWAVIGRLPETEDAEARAIVIDRAFKVPNLDDELSRTLVSGFARYRHASLEFIKYMDASRRDPKWGALVTQAIYTTASEISTHADWLVPNETGNPRPVQFIARMTESAEWFPESKEMMSALGQLKLAVGGLPVGAARDSALAALPK